MQKNYININSEVRSLKEEAKIEAGKEVVRFVINHSAEDKGIEINLRKQYSIEELTADFTAHTEMIQLHLLPNDVRIFLLH